MQNITRMVINRFTTLWSECLKNFLFATRWLTGKEISVLSTATHPLLCDIRKLIGSNFETHAEDIDKKTVDFQPNLMTGARTDGFPARLPNLLSTVVMELQSVWRRKSRRII